MQIAICIAVHTKDVVPLSITFATFKFCENLTLEDNFNNTFLLKKYHSLQTALQSYGKASAKIVKGVESCFNFPINLYGFTRNYVEKHINCIE